MSSNEAAVLYSAAEVQARLDCLAHHVREDYAGRSPLVVGILNGARKVTEEIAKRLPMACAVRYIIAKSYGNGLAPSGRIIVERPWHESVNGNDVLIVDDIVDTGQTLTSVIGLFRQESPRSLRVFVLANKPLRRRVRVHLDYVGFTVPNRFIVGWGMGRGEEFRDLPFLGYIRGT